MTDGIDKRGTKTMVPNFIRSVLADKIKWEMNQPGISNPTACIRHSMLIARLLLISLTSFFYLIGPPQSPLSIKIMVVMAMMTAVLLTRNLYGSSEIDDILIRIYDPQKLTGQANPPASASQKPYLLLTIIGIETLGTAMLTVPTGGLDSPFVWYALSPIIAAAFYLPFYYSWITMGLFLSFALLFRYTLLEISSPLTWELLQHMSLIMLFCLCTALAQLAASLYRNLSLAYSQLDKAHQESEKAFAHISSLYQVMEACSAGEDCVQMADLLAGYAARLCQRPSACLMIQERNREEDIESMETLLRMGGDQNPLDHTVWEKEMNQIWNRIEPDMTDVLSWDIGLDHRLVYHPITSHGECFGILAYLEHRRQKDQNTDQEKSLAFLAGLGGITLERLKTDKLWGRLLVSEEQNRIANEIHDGVAQYLFSSVCAVHTLSQQKSNLQDENIQQQLKLLQDTFNRASRELKASIYGLSPHKRGESIFVETMASYLDGLGKLHGIQVDLQAEGSEEVISPALRKALYRMVREASSNALRHGKCSSIKVSLGMYPGQTLLEVQDNGTGWKFKGLRADEKAGLGLRNMVQAAELFGGELEIESRYGKGTTIRCVIPKAAPNDEKEVLKYETGTYR